MARTAISDRQRKALRTYYRSQTPRPRQRDCINWWREQFGGVIRQSSISEILSDRYSFLDEQIIPTDNSFRQRISEWPLLEEILSSWQARIEARGGVTSGDILTAKAREIWPQIPQYHHLPTPQFSAGWLQKFKRRYHIQKYNLHGEAASVPEEASTEMRAVQTLCGEYREEDIYNMDETGLYWRRALSSGLSSAPRPGVKRDKSRISIVCCCNFAGSHKLPLWLIGNAKLPRALRGVNFQALGCVWRSNSKAWMNTLIMAEWLRSFYQSIDTSRCVLLLMDNLRAHGCGVDLAPPPPHIQIQYLPKNATSIYQPLDQGIIESTKRYYKRRWLSFMVTEYDQERDPLATMHLHHAVCWINHAWIHDLSATTIYRCFRKAKIYAEAPTIDLPAEQPVEISALYQSAVQTAISSGLIREAMSLSNFLNPDSEDLYLHEADIATDGQILQELISFHTTGTTNQVEEEEDEEDEIVDIPVPTVREALKASQALQQYLLHQEDTQTHDIRHLERLERLLNVHIASSQQQSTLGRWFT